MYCKVKRKFNPFAFGVYIDLDNSKIGLNILEADRYYKIKKMLDFSLVIYLDDDREAMVSKGVVDIFTKDERMVEDL